MNFLNAIEGLKGENLSTAVLRLLLLRSQDLRERFISLLSDKCRLGPLAAGDHFACLLEPGTEDPESGRSGRLDLVIETADAVIGVENKLSAAFQQGQPAKYLESLKNRADNLTKLRGRSFQHVLAILAPRRRSQEIESKIGENDHYIFLPWEDILESLDDAVSESDAASRVLFQSFDEFLNENIGFMPNFPRWVPHLRRRFDPYGTPRQREVVSRLWEFFPDAGTRISSGKTWVGYYFAKYQAWYGFISSAEAITSGAKHPSELIVATSFPVVAPIPPFRSITLRQENFLGKGRQVIAWAIDYDEEWADPKRWRDALQPLSDAVEALATEVAPPQGAPASGEGKTTL